MHRSEVHMFTTKWLNDNRIIGCIFSALALVNAFAIFNGYYR